MITLQKKDKEVEINLTFEHRLGGKPAIQITGSADLSHHLIEGLFDILDRLSKMEDCCHRAGEWRGNG